GEAVELLDDVRTEALAVLRRQAVGLSERLDVGPQRGDRCAQLVRGVGHQLPLCLHRALERIERGVEAPRQPGELVAALHVEAVRWVRVRRDRLGATREA